MTVWNDRDLDVPAVVVSADAHAGPRLIEDLRPYCPGQHRDAYDAMVEENARQMAAAAAMPKPPLHPRATENDEHPYLGPGHYDPDVRLAHMDADGVAAEVFYHQSQNGEPMPWADAGLRSTSPEHFPLAAVGFSIYNRWLADFCSKDPERLLGLVHVPLWDIDASVKQLELARNAGLRGVSFPPPDRPGLLPYNDLAYEPFWSACEDLGFSLHTHASGPRDIEYYLHGPGGFRIMFHETTSYMTRRATWWLILGEVFERHPKLKLFQTEQNGGWYLPTMWEMDSLYLTLSRPMGEMKRLPSEYMKDHVFYGASFPAPQEVQAAVAEGWSDNMLWGRDYPHREGTYRPAPDSSSQAHTKQAIRHVFSTVPTDDAVSILGQNGIRALGLDGGYLATVAEKIGALTPREISEPLTTVPDDDSMAFVGIAGARPVEDYRLSWSDRYR